MGQVTTVSYTPWRLRVVRQGPNRGSGSNGNFVIGLTVDRHPRFVNVFVCLWFVEFGLCWERDAIIE